jgi:hypothetical protein
VSAQGMGEQEIINVLKLANNNEVLFLQEKVEYLRTEINNLELKKTECTIHVLTLNRRVDKPCANRNCQPVESSLNEKREEIAFLNREQKRLDNVVNNNGDKNDNNVEVIYASGDWHNLTP